MRDLHPAVRLQLAEYAALRAAAEVASAEARLQPEAAFVDKVV